MKIHKLDESQLGSLLKANVLAACLGNHQTVADSIPAYRDASTLESEFIIDIFTLTTSEIVNKWFDGHEAAINLIMEQS